MNSCYAFLAYSATAPHPHRHAAHRSTAASIQDRTILLYKALIGQINRLMVVMDGQNFHRHDRAMR